MRQPLTLGNLLSTAASNRRSNLRCLVPSLRWLAKPKPAFAIASAGLPSRSRAQAIASARRRLVAREGLEPSKPLGRQIYSLLRLTASLPRQLSVFVETRAFGRSYIADGAYVADGAGEGI